MIRVIAPAAMTGGREKDMTGKKHIIADEMSTEDTQMKSILLIMEEKGLNMKIVRVEQQVTFAFLSLLSMFSLYVVCI